MYIIMSETFIEIDSLQHLKFQDKPMLRNGQKSALQHALFWRYANFFQINEDNRYIHDSYISVWVLSMFYIQKMR